jgi:hypothetical protein
LFVPIASPPAMVDVAVVEVALKNPKVGVEVATICPLALVERRELIAVAPYVSVPLNVFVFVNVFAVYVFGSVVLICPKHY